MLNGNDMIISLIVGLIKKYFVKKGVNTFLSSLEVLKEILMLMLIFQIMQQKLILKM